jgi:hypothetical protein
MGEVGLGIKIKKSKSTVILYYRLVLGLMGEVGLGIKIKKSKSTGGGELYINITKLSCDVCLIAKGCGD